MQAGQLMPEKLEISEKNHIIGSHMPTTNEVVNKEDVAALYALLASSWIRSGNR